MQVEPLAEGLELHADAVSVSDDASWLKKIEVRDILFQKPHMVLKN